MMDADELARLWRLADAATPGPWTHADAPEGRWPAWDVLAPARRDPASAARTEPCIPFSEADAAFIAAARTAVPALVAEVERLRAAATGDQPKAWWTIERLEGAIAALNRAEAETRYVNCGNCGVGNPDHGGYCCRMCGAQLEAKGVPLEGHHGLGVASLAALRAWEAEARAAGDRMVAAVDGLRRGDFALPSWRALVSDRVEALHAVLARKVGP